MMQFQLCENVGFYLRLGLIGSSGSGKTWTALSVASALGYDKIGVIDTENKSARRYARSFPQRFVSLELEHFSPRDYVEAIRTAEAAGIDVLIIDSLSHAWMGRGGVLEMVDQSAKRQARGNGGGSSFNGWREVTPEHNRLVDALVHAKMHIIVTMRVKTEYVVEKDQNGKSIPRKVGLAPVQREGLEYEFDVVGDLSPEHDLAITKSRCPALADLVINRPGAPLAEALRAWLDGVQPTPEAEPAAPGTVRVLPQRGEAPGAEQGEAEHTPPPRAPKVLTLEVAQELAAIAPWIARIKEAEVHGSEEQLDAVRSEMNTTLKRRTVVQGEALRRAIETARAAIRVLHPRRDEGEASAEELQAVADAAADEKRPRGPQGYADN